MVKFIESHCSTTTSTVTVKDAYFAREFKTGSWVGLFVMVIHEFTGINAILLYSNQMLSSGADSKISPREGTDIIGVVYLLSACMAVWTAKKFARRTLLIWGHVLMGICHCLVGLGFQLNNPNLTLIAMCLFIFFYANSSGCITWLYCSEVSVDAALGLIGTAGYGITFFLSLVTEPLMVSPLQKDGTFYMFGAISLMAAVWC